MLELLAPLLIHPSFRLWRLGRQSLSSPPYVVVFSLLMCVCHVEEFSGSPEALGPRSALAPTTEM